MVCRNFVEWLKDNGFKVIYFDERDNKCLIDFIQPGFPSGIRPLGVYASSIIIDKKRSVVTEANYNRVFAGKKDFFEFYIPKECGEEDNICRVHIDFDITERGKRIGRAGFLLGADMNIERAKEFIIGFFLV